jgi:DNA-binding PadR family transcriptional regulator
VTTRTDRIHTSAQSSDMAVLLLLRDRPHPTEYLAVSAKTQGISLYDGNIYQVLERLMGEGLVEREWAPGGNGLPQRLYRLTTVGERVAARFDAGPA